MVAHHNSQNSATLSLGQKTNTLAAPLAHPHTALHLRVIPENRKTKPPIQPDNAETAQSNPTQPQLLRRFGLYHFCVLFFVPDIKLQHQFLRINNHQ